MVSPQSTATLQPQTWSVRQAIERVWLGALIVVVLLLAFVNLPYAPATWFDEGSHLHVPKTLVQHGVYADISSEGYRYYGPTVGIGPTVMLPIALAFKLWGIGVLQGRLVIVAYLLVAFGAAYALARRMHGELAGLLALTLLLASRSVRFDGAIEYGRQVVGEIPGVAFLLLATLAWLAALHSSGRRQLLLATLAGFGFGFALVTKNQFALIVPPTLVLVAVLDVVYYRAASWPLRIIPCVIACGCFGIWLLAQVQFLGPGSFAENLQLTRKAAGGAIFVFDRGATLRAAAYVLRPDLFGGALVPAILYGIWRARRRDAHGLAEALVVVLVALWLVWFVGASLGWPRYAFPAVAFGALLVARALTDLIGWLWRGTGLRRGFAFVAVGYTTLIVAVPLALSTRAVLRPDDSAQRMAVFLAAHVPSQAVVETWEPELGVLTDHRYHYPPIALLDTAVRHQWLGGPAIAYDGLQDRPPYVVVGNFGQYTGIYSAEMLGRDYSVFEQIGPYTLYRQK